MAKILRFRRSKGEKQRPERSLFDPVEAREPRPPEEPTRPQRRPSSDATPLLPPPSDAIPAEELPGRAGPDPEVERRRRLRRRMRNTLLALVFAAGLFACVFGSRGYLDIRQSRQQLDALQADYAEEQERYRRLLAETATLSRDTRGLERLAREQLNYARKGEVIILLPEDPSDALDRPGGSAIVPDASGTTTRGGAVR